MAILVIIFLIAISLIIFWQISTLISIAGGVQYVASNKVVFYQALKLANIKKDDILYELGSGYGENLIIANREFKIKAVGIEISPFHYFVSRLKTRRYCGIKIIKANFDNVNLSKADIVYCYLLPKMLAKLSQKLKNELKLGAQVISYGFPLAKIKSAKIKKLAGHQVYFYQF